MNRVTAKDGFDEPVTDELLQRAAELGEQRQRCSLHASTVQYVMEAQALRIGFADQSAVVLPIKNYPEFAQLSHAQLGRLSLGYAGSALCLDEQDLQVSIAGLVSASAPLMEMAVTMVATRNGSQRSAAKTIAARHNGLKGGRPRKMIATG